MVLINQSTSDRFGLVSTEWISRGTPEGFGTFQNAWIRQRWLVVLQLVFSLLKESSELFW
jgi:hypothetical protein